LVFVVNSQGTVTIQDGVWTTFTVAADSIRETVVTYINDGSDTVVNVTYNPCYGFVTLYFGVDVVPTKDTSLTIPWSSQSQTDFSYPLQGNNTLYLLFYANQAFPGTRTDISAQVQLVVSAHLEPIALPQPANGGTIKGYMETGGAKGHIFWSKTNVASDNYTVYYLNSTTFNTANTGYYSGNGCSTQDSMQVLTTDLSVSYISSNNSYSATFTNLNPKQTLPVTVLLTDSDTGLTSVYEVIYLNIALKSCLAYSYQLLFIIAFLSVMLF